MNFYQQCPFDHGYPRFACETFLDAELDSERGAHRHHSRDPKWHGNHFVSQISRHARQQQPAWLATARLLGDYLVKEVLTPDTGKYPAFTRSTGRRAQFPQPADCGSQSDRPYEIQPDKGGIAGYALVLLFEATGEAQVSGAGAAKCARAGRESARRRRGHSPWPFRADYRSGEGRGPDIRKHDLHLAAIRSAGGAWLSGILGAAAVAVALDQGPPNPQRRGATARCSRSSSKITTRPPIAAPGRR